MEPNQPNTPKGTSGARSSANPAGTSPQGATAGQDQKQDDNASNQNSSYATGDAGKKATSGSSASAESKDGIDLANLQQKAVDQVPQGVRDFLTKSWSQVGKLSTTEKVVGVAALVGLGYFTLRGGGKSKKEKSKSYGSYRGSAAGGYQGSSSRDESSDYRPGSTYGSKTYGASGSSSSARADRGPSSGSSYSSGSDSSFGANKGGSSSLYGTSGSSHDTPYRGSARSSDSDDSGYTGS